MLNAEDGDYNVAGDEKRALWELLQRKSEVAKEAKSSAKRTSCFEGCMLKVNKCVKDTGAITSTSNRWTTCGKRCEKSS